MSFANVIQYQRLVMQIAAHSARRPEEGEIEEWVDGHSYAVDEHVRALDELKKRCTSEWDEMSKEERKRIEPWVAWTKKRYGSPEGDV